MENRKIVLFDRRGCGSLITGISDAQDRKAHAIRYLDIDDYDLWSEIPVYGAGSTWAQFKDAVYQLYPGSQDTDRYSLSDLESLIKQGPSLIKSKGDFGTFYRQFIHDTTWLKTKNRANDFTISQALIQSLPATVHQKVVSRLAIKLPDHHPDNVYPVSDLHDAITFCLHGTSLSPILAIPTPSTPVKVEKTEDALAKALVSMTEKNNQLLTTLTSFLQTSTVSASSSNVPRAAPANSDFSRA